MREKETYWPGMPGLSNGPLEVTSPHITQSREIRDIRDMNKENKTPEDWLKARKWTKFLLSLPLNKAKNYAFSSVNDLFSLKVVAAHQNKSDGNRRYSIVAVNYQDCTATITANLKN